MSKIKKTTFILLSFIALTLITSPFVNCSEKSEEINGKDLQKKSELQGTALSNLRQTYYHNGSAIIENKESNDQFLKNTILLMIFLQVINGIMIY